MKSKLGIVFLLLVIFVSSQKVIDVFPFNGERIAHLRMTYLEDFVDLFVMVEARYTFTGKKKKVLYLEYYQHWFKELQQQGKIKTIIIDMFPMDVKSAKVDTENPDLFWQREFYQRDVIADEVLKLYPNETFVLLSSDADEIPRIDLVKSLRSRYNDFNEWNHAEMVMFYYSFKWVKPGDQWTRLIILNDMVLRKKEKTLTFMRNHILHRIYDGGWHCSYCMSPERILHKIQSFSELPHFGKEYANLVWIKRCIDEGIDILNRNYSDILTLYDGKKGLPICKKCSLTLTPINFFKEAETEELVSPFVT